MSQDIERRIGAHRAPIETRIEIGEGGGGSAAFEADSVNISTDGMHLRAAYLPEIGDAIVCRFNANGAEVVVQGEVIWRNDEAFGGDFGIRFIEMDPESLATLRELLGEEPEIAARGAVVPDQPAIKMARDTRVNLNVAGLGTVLKTRVQEATVSEALVRTNFDNLKIGGKVDLENLEASTMRPARVERVSVEIDPATRVPQLMVAVRYLDADDDVRDKPTASRRPGQQAGSVEERFAAEDSPYDDNEQDDGAGRSAALWNKMKEVGPKLAILGDKAKVLGGRAKDVLTRAIDRARSKQSAQEGEDGHRFSRVTSPPASAIRAESKRLREEGFGDEMQELTSDPKKKMLRRAAAIGAAVLMVAVLVVALTRKSAKPAGELAAGDASADVAAPEGAPADSVAAAEVAPNAQAGLMANVPLFGPMAMANGLPAAPVPAIVAAAPRPAAAVPPPADNAEAGEDDGAKEAGDGEDAAAGGAIVAAGDKADDSEDEADDGSAHAAAPAKHARPGSAKSSAGSFGRGKVRNPTVLSLRMNQAIKAVHGSANANGFTVEIVGARAKEGAGGLVHQDRRIASAKVINKGASAEMVVRFREPVPGYRVMAQGNTLRILMGNDKNATANAASDRPAARPHTTTPANGSKKSHGHKHATKH